MAWIAWVARVARMRFTLLALFVVVCGCPPTPEAGVEGGASGGPVASCTGMGMQCMFAPGKIGTCVQRSEPCEGKACFVCQSQH